MIMENDKILQSRFLDLAEKADKGCYYTYSSFLSLADQDLLLKTKVNTPYSLFGGYENAERKLAVFGSEEYFGYTEEAPIVCLKIEPLMQKYADKLTHRDFLGSVIGLGLERDVTGDIIIHENVGYMLCLESIADFIAENLTKVRRTDVKCTRIDAPPVETLALPEEKSFFVASERLDAVIAEIFGLSRSETQKLFGQKLIFENSRLCEKPDKTLAENTLVSVRGYGRFIYCGVEKTTKKGRLRITARVYR
jgi:RNA-binding protein YlmH